MKVVPRKTIKKAVREINNYYDRLNPNGYIRKDYLVKNKVVKEQDIDILISRLEALGIIEYSRHDMSNEYFIKRTTKCKCYFEEDKELTRRLLFPNIAAIVSAIISVVSFVMSLVALKK